jgi:hypothetical protein
MAILNKHGEAFILELTWHRKAYCTDGSVLSNYGDTWRKTGTLKPGVTAEQAYKHQLAIRDEILSKRHYLSELRRLIYAATKSWKKRMWLKTAVETLYDDPDGMWAELQDCTYAPKLGVDECAKIGTAYRNAIAEYKAIRGIRQ